MKTINSKTKEDITKYVILFLEEKITKKEFEEATKLTN